MLILLMAISSILTFYETIKICHGNFKALLKFALIINGACGYTKIDYHHKKNRAVLGDIPFIQVVQEDNVTEKDENGIYPMSAPRFFG